MLLAFPISLVSIFLFNFKVVVCTVIIKDPIISVSEEKTVFINFRLNKIHFYNDIDVWELYDLQNDPMEMHNIYNEPGNEALIDSLKTELNKLQEQYDDPIETELATAKK